MKYDEKILNRRKNFFFVVVVFLVSQNGFGQQTVADDSSSISWKIDEDSLHQNSFYQLIIHTMQPALLTDVQTVRAYIRTERFQELRKQYGDVSAVDFIYLKSLEMAHHDVQYALFVSFLAVLEHRTIQIKTPLRFTIPMLLTFETDSAFIIRVRHLPNNLYDDSPPGIARDRDKLQHFFGSAFLSYVLHQPDIAQTIGDLIEWAEPGLVVGGENDPRDKRANLQGDEFGRDLSVVDNLLPSDYLTLPHKDRK